MPSYTEVTGLAAVFVADTASAKTGIAALNALVDKSEAKFRQTIATLELLDEQFARTAKSMAGVGRSASAGAAEMAAAYQRVDRSAATSGTTRQRSAQQASQAEIAAARRSSQEQIGQITQSVRWKVQSDRMRAADAKKLAADEASAARKSAAEQAAAQRAVTQAYKREMAERKAATSQFWSGLRQVSQQTGQLGMGMTMGITAPVAAFAVSSVKESAEYGGEMAKIQGLAGVPKSMVDQWRPAILQISEEFGQMATDGAEGIFRIASEGQRGAQALDTLRTAEKMAAIGMGEVKDNAYTLSYVMHDTGLSAKEVGDVLVASAREGNFSVETLTTNLNKAVVPAHLLHISFQSTAAAIAAMTRSGMTVPQATTSLGGLFSELMKAPPKGEEELIRVGLGSYAKLREEARKDLYGTLNKIFQAEKGNPEGLHKIFPDVRGMRAELTQTFSDVKGIYDEVNNSGGALDKAFGVRKDTVAQQLAQDAAAFEHLKIVVGDDFAPVTKVVLKDFRALLDEFMAAPESTRHVVEAFVGILATVGPVLWGMSKAAQVAATYQLFVANAQRNVASTAGPAIEEEGALAGAYGRTAEAAEAAAYAQGQAAKTAGGAGLGGVGVGAAEAGEGVAAGEAAGAGGLIALAPEVVLAAGIIAAGVYTVEASLHKLNDTSGELTQKTDAMWKSEATAAQANAEHAAKVKHLYGEIDTLSKKTHKTHEEAKTLNDDLNKLAQAAPEYVKGYTKTGDAMGYAGGQANYLAQQATLAGQAVHRALVMSTYMPMVNQIAQDRIAAKDRLSNLERNGLTEKAPLYDPTRDPYVLQQQGKYLPKTTLPYTQTNSGPQYLAAHAAAIRAISAKDAQEKAIMAEAEKVMHDPKWSPAAPSASPKNDPDGGGGGDGKKHKKSEAEKEAEKAAQALTDKLGNLAQAYRLLGKESDAAALKDELLNGEFVTGKRQTEAFNDTLHKLLLIRKSLFDQAATSLYGKGHPFDSLTLHQKDFAAALAMQTGLDQDKKQKENLKEYSNLVHEVKAGANEARIALLKLQHPDELDQLALDSPFHMLYADIKDKRVQDALRQMASDEMSAHMIEYTRKDSGVQFDYGPSAEEIAKRKQEERARLYDANEGAVFDFGDEYTKRNKDNYSKSLNEIGVELGKFSKQSEAARIDAIQFDNVLARTGQRMDRQQATQIEHAQEYLAKVKAYHEEIQQMAGGLAGAVTGTAGFILNHGFKGAAGNFAKEMAQSSEQMLMGKLQSGLEAWIIQRVGHKGEPAKPKDLPTALDIQTSATDRNTQAIRDWIEFEQQIYGGPAMNHALGDAVGRHDLANSRADQFMDLYGLTGDLNGSLGAVMPGPGGVPATPSGTAPSGDGSWYPDDPLGVSGSGPGGNTAALYNQSQAAATMNGGGGGSAPSRSSQDFIAVPTAKGSTVAGTAADDILQETMGKRFGAIAGTILAMFPNALAFGGMPSFLKGFASGGVWDGRSPIRVHAGEMVLPANGTGATVLNKADTRNLEGVMSGGGASQIINQTWNITAPDPGAFRPSERQSMRDARMGVRR